jgi:aspartate/methionine/tyrosine aminotransferase
MNETQRVRHSDYMTFAKTRQASTYNLAISGIAGYPMSEFPFEKSDIEINGPNNYGYKPLLHAIGERYRVDQSCITTAFGTSMANFLVFSALLDRGDEILVEKPAYELLLSGAGFTGVTINRFERREEDAFALDPAAIKRAITPKTKLILLCNLHNPTSAYTGDATLKEIGKIAATVGAYVMVDEVYLEALFATPPPTSFHLGDNFIVTSSLTKVFGLSGLRCGWIFAQPALTQRFWQIADISYGSASFIPEKLSVNAFKNLPKMAARSRNLLDTNRALLNRFLDSCDELELSRPKYGTMIFPRLRTLDVDTFCDHLRNKYQTTVVPGRFFETPKNIRIGLCGEIEPFKVGLENIGKAINDLRR